jgi:lysozyme family protein
MVAPSFGVALARVLEHEGGNDDDPHDPGGRTSRGITAGDWTEWRKTHPGLPSDVWQAPQEQIEAIYKTKYWDKNGCDALPAGLDYCVFDCAVLEGSGRALPWLAQVKDLSVLAAINKFCDLRLAHLQSLDGWARYGRGWGTRVADVRRDALAMAKAKPSTPLSTNEHHNDVPSINLLDPDRILATALAHGAPWDRDPQHCHLFYIEGCNLDGTPNDNRIDKWNDVRGILKFIDGEPQIVFKCKATTAPGIYYDRIHVIGGPQGAALIDFGYQVCWQVNIHHAGKPGAHEALCQTGGACRVYRDFDKSFRRQNGHITTGWYGINHHSTGPGYHADPDSVGPWSAGCLVAEDYQDHLAWMRLVKTDSRYVANHEHVFGVIVMPATWVAEAIAAASSPQAGSAMPARIQRPKPPLASQVGIAAAVASGIAVGAHVFGAHPVLIATVLMAGLVAAVIAVSRAL